jgi:hypothetical protein
LARRVIVMQARFLVPIMILFYFDNDKILFRSLVWWRWD